MARLLRVCVPGSPHHVIQRGNNRQTCFAATEDFAAYAYWLKQYSDKFGVTLHAWVFMTNHAHLLLTPGTEDGIPRTMQSLGRQYVRYFNHAYKRTGTLWEGRYKSCVVDAEAYLLTCQRYIELNPVRAGMVRTPEEYPWSSYQVHALGKSAPMWQPHASYLRLANDREERCATYRTLCRASMDEDTVRTIRETTNKGLALGNDRFKAEIEQLTGRRASARKRGRKANTQD